MPFGGVQSLEVGLVESSFEHAARVVLDAYGWSGEVKLTKGNPEKPAQDGLRGRKESLAAEIETTETIDPMLPGELTLGSSRKEIQPINPAPRRFHTAVSL